MVKKDEDPRKDRKVESSRMPISANPFFQEVAESLCSLYLFNLKIENK